MGGMGGTRVDASNRQPTAPDCDEQTMTCGAEPQPEALVSKPDPLVSTIDEDWHPPMLAEDKPSHRAEVARNMAAQKTQDPPGVTTRPVAHAGLTPSHDGVEVDLAFHKTPGTTVAEVGVQASAQQIGPHATLAHKQLQTKIAGVDVSVSADAGSVEYGPGVKNADGSKGLHVGGNATTVGAEVTLHKQGVGSVTAGASGGLSAEASVGVKKDGNAYEACGRVSAAWFTVGVCFPVWSTRN